MEPIATRKPGQRGPNKQPRHTWTPDEISFLESNLHLSKKAIAAHIGCTPDSVKNALRKNGLKLQSTGRYAPGNVPYYKGKKKPEHIRMKGAATWFTKGNRPHNTKHVGYISVRKDAAGRQYFWIIVGDNQYQHLHRYLWEREHGPVPPGHRIIFKDGNQGNCVIENLEMVTDQEAMRRNSILRYPREIADAMRLIGKLNQTIKQHHGTQSE